MKSKPNSSNSSLLLERAEAMRPLLANRLAHDFPAFVKKAWTVLQPNRQLIWSWHYDYLCEQLTLVKQRQLLRLIVNVPPRTLKSTIITIAYPVWVWLTEPGHNFMAASYSMELSTDHSLMRRKLLQSEWFQRLWGDKFHMSADRNQAAQFMNDRGGQMIATSVGGSPWGRGCDTAILDDPLSADQAQSDTERTKANGWIDTTFRSRLNDPATGAIILVMQRLHEFDPTGFLLEQEPGVWTLTRIPLEAEEDERWVCPLSGKVVQRRRGEILQPKRFTPAVVNEKRASRLVFAAQYQQRPAPAEGNMIKRSEVRYYGGIDPRTGQADEKLPENFDFKIVSVDCAFKDLPTSDFVAICVIGIKGGRRFILNVINEHLDAAGTEAEIRRQLNVHRPICAVLVEDKANGSAVIQRLKLNVPGVIAINPQGGKTARMFAAAAEWHSGDWLLDRRAASTEPFIEQITTFPNGRNDDMCDSMSQAACWLQQRSVPTVMIYNAFTGKPFAEFPEGHF
jgi:predicted phage terminase large subunit-like protein